MIGLIGSTMLWVGYSRTHTAHARPAISASAAPGKTSPVKTVLHPAASHADGLLEADVRLLVRPLN